MERFLEEIVGAMDFLVYKPLFYFLNSKEELKPLEMTVVRIQAAIRRFLVNRRLTSLVIAKYRKELASLRRLLLDGIEVLVVISKPEEEGSGLHKRVLWLAESPGEPGLSRLCLTRVDEFKSLADELQRAGGDSSDSEIESVGDGRDSTWLYEKGTSGPGIFLSDIAEVRAGPASHGFGPMLTSDMESGTCAPDHILDISRCVTVVGTEATLDIQLVDIGRGTRIRSRAWFVDILFLLATQSLGQEERALRQRVWWRRVEGTGNRRPRLSQARQKEAILFADILTDSIQVDEELFDRSCALGMSPSETRIVGKTMWLEPASKRFLVADSFMEVALAQKSAPVIRGLDVDDISEIRPGRMSFACDGSAYLTCLTIVGSETCICLPVDSVAIRNGLLRQFQSFILYNRNHERGMYRPTCATQVQRTSLKKESLLHAMSSPSKPPTRRKSTPASLNKSYCHEQDDLWVRANAPHGSEYSPLIKPGSSVPKDFWMAGSAVNGSPRRHSTMSAPETDVEYGAKSADGSTTGPVSSDSEREGDISALLELEEGPTSAGIN
eukprot:CAMPEP_0185026808 /NCGR_PEP_ID=MMETSP1103-20130426/11276_1 /TAXON_ID=36769 /ORGANISM="Paraphysomonas bandaiensis, Strain Caron Lab Isolate" /LENGTH=553 /DNA_ID=CAMNT_0027560515 /DNA_START=500 /DNA_END=2161 /DNA_ORIENTATION=+